MEMQLNKSEGYERKFLKDNQDPSKTHSDETDKVPVQVQLKRQKQNCIEKKTKPRPICHICTKSFSSLQSRNNHLKIHSKPPGSTSNTNIYNCPTCPKIYKTKLSFDLHLKWHDEQRLLPDNGLQCKICFKYFDNPKPLMAHQTYHKRVENQKNHECKTCLKKFMDRIALKMHMRKHTGEKPHVCLWCFKRFTQKNNLATHLRTHTKEKQYFCSICKEAFDSMRMLQIHSLKFHS